MNGPRYSQFGRRLGEVHRIEVAHRTRVCLAKLSSSEREATECTNRPLSPLDCGHTVDRQTF